MHPTQTLPEHTDELSTQSTAEANNSKNYPLLTRQKIPDTPFYIVGSEDIGYKITWGKFTFTEEPIPTITEASMWLQTHQWEAVLHLIAIGIGTAETTKKSL